MKRIDIEQCRDCPQCTEYWSELRCYRFELWDGCEPGKIPDEGIRPDCPLPDAPQAPCEHVGKSVLHTREGWCLAGRSDDSHTAFYVDMTHCPFCGAKLPEVG